MAWTNYIDDAVRGFGSVADDIIVNQTGQRIKQGIVDRGVELASNIPNISADDAMDIMARAYTESDDFYRNFVAKNGMTPEDAINIPYRIGRGAAHTGQFARNNAGTALNLGMNAMFLAPMAMQMLPRSQEEQMYG
jgi:hypothetical protein